MVCAIVIASLLAKNSRSFRPLQSIGGQTLAARLCGVLLDAGADQIIVMTGHREGEVREALRNLPITTRHDPHYEEGDMLRSLKAGLAGNLDKFDTFLFAPVCIPVFSAESVRKLLACGAPAAAPVLNGVNGHPLMFDAQTARFLNAYSGTGGVKGALAASGTEITYIPVERSVTEGRIHPEAMILLSGKDVFFGPESRHLLLSVKSKGSVLGACEAIGISYSKGRSLIRRMENALGFTLVERTTGGAAGGSSRLTSDGELFLETFAQYEQAVTDYANEVFDTYFQQWGTCI